VRTLSLRPLNHSCARRELLCLLNAPLPALRRAPWGGRRRSAVPASLTISVLSAADSVAQLLDDTRGVFAGKRFRLELDFKIVHVDRYRRSAATRWPSKVSSATALTCASLLYEPKVKLPRHVQDYAILVLLDALQDMR